MRNWSHNSWCLYYLLQAVHTQFPNWFQGSNMSCYWLQSKAICRTRRTLGPEVDGISLESLYNIHIFKTQNWKKYTMTRRAPLHILVISMLYRNKSSLVLNMLDSFALENSNPEITTTAWDEPLTCTTTDRISEELMWTAFFGGEREERGTGDSQILR